MCLILHMTCLVDSSLSPSLAHNRYLMSRLVSLCERGVFFSYRYGFGMGTKDSLSKADVDIIIGEVVFFILTVCTQNCLSSASIS